MFSTEYMAGFFDGEGSIGIYSSLKDGRKVGFALRTQLTQTVSVISTNIMTEMKSRYGGNLNVMDRSASRLAYNWQLNGNLAVKFLTIISPYLHLKKDQAYIAMAWQTQRPVLVRNARGHIVFKSAPLVEFDSKVAVLMKLLKIQDMDVVLANRSDLVEVLSKLKRVLVFKDTLPTREAA